jgi:hypothetical protein
MPLDHPTTSTSVIDVLDHVLDKGIVIDAWVRVSLVGIDLITVEARIVVASIDTYLNYAQTLAELAPVAPPTIRQRVDVAGASSRPSARRLVRRPG